MSQPESLTDDAKLVAGSGPDSDELADLETEATPDLAGVHLAALRSPVVVRALLGIAIGLAIITWPERSDRILARLIGLGAMTLFGTAAWSALTARPRRLVEAAATTVGLVVAAAVVVVPDQAETTIGRLIGAALILMAARDVVRVIGRRRDEATDGASDEGSTAWVLSRSVAVAGFGGLLLAFPGEVFGAALALVAVGWIGLSALVVVAALDGRTAGRADYASASRYLDQWLDDRPKAAQDRRALYGKILYEGDAVRMRVVRFFVLMGFASVIASMGVITDSTAVVIGAMLIAPLMSPLMGIAISLVMGWPRRLARSVLVAAGGIVFAITIGIFLGLTVPAAVDTATNAQIVARSSPTMLDMITALAAGAAGAYGLSRPDVSDSLPGVAIAISLVPPLTVVGIAISQGDLGAASGALLLFATNMLAIMVMGGLTFVVTGVTPVRQVAENQHRVRTAVAAVVALAALVIGALLLNGAQVAGELFETATVDDTVQEWLDEHPDYGLVRTDVGEGVVGVAIIGPADGAPTAASLAEALADALDRSVTVDLRLVVEERTTATAGG